MSVAIFVAAFSSNFKAKGECCKQGNDLSLLAVKKRRYPVRSASCLKAIFSLGSAMFSTR